MTKENVGYSDCYKELESFLWHYFPSFFDAYDYLGDYKYSKYIDIGKFTSLYNDTYQGKHFNILQCLKEEVATDKELNYLLSLSKYLMFQEFILNDLLSEQNLDNKSDWINKLTHFCEQKISESIDNKSDLFVYSEIGRILRGLDLLRIECTSISIEELQKNLNEVTTRLENIRKINESDYDYQSSPKVLYSDEIENSLNTDIKNLYKDIATTALPSMFFSWEYEVLEQRFSDVQNAMLKILKREGNVDTIVEVNALATELYNEAESLNQRINSDEKDDLTWNYSGETQMDEIYLPTTIVFDFLSTYFDWNYGEKKYYIKDFFISLANNKYDVVFDWDVNKAQEITNNDYYTEPNSSIKIYNPKRINEFHEYLIEKISELIEEIKKLNDNHYQNIYYYMLLMTITSINYSLKTKRDNLAIKKKTLY